MAKMWDREFPSPCGVMGVKQLGYCFWNLFCSLVSVPLRGNGCETIAVSEVDGCCGIKFPSPCGVMGVKPLTFLRLTQKGFE